MVSAGYGCWMRHGNGRRVDVFGVKSNWQPPEPPEPKHWFRGKVVREWKQSSDGKHFHSIHFCKWRPGIWQPDLTVREQGRLLVMRYEIDELGQWWSDEMDTACEGN